jgi:hypothetical protein
MRVLADSSASGPAVRLPETGDARVSAFRLVARVGSTARRDVRPSGDEMGLAVVAVATGLCFAGAIAAITIGLGR